MPDRLPPIFPKSMASLGWAVLVATACNQPLSAGPASFNQAVSDYNAGKYAQSLTELEAYAAAYPNNSLVHYYIALCHQGTGRLEKAKTEFEWVAKNGDAKLRSMAQAGLQQLSRVHTQATTIASASQPTSSRPTIHFNGPKVTKVLEFYTDW